MRISIMRKGILLMAVILMAIGIQSGDPTVVLQKAVTICLECVGIG